MKVKDYLLGIIFVFVSFLLLIFISIFSYFDQKFEIDSIKSIAVVEKITNDSVYVSFSDQTGKRHYGRLNYYSSSMRVNDKIEIYYKENNPNEFKATLDQKFFISFYVISIVFILLGGIFIIIPFRKNKQAIYLKKNGIQLEASIQDVVLNQSYTVNNQHPYIILASFLYEDKVYTAKSKNLWFDVNFVLKNFSIKKLPVYIDSKDPSKNYLDTLELNKYIEKK